MTETVLVTGGTGFVGGWSIVELLKQGYNVRTTVRSLSKEASVRAAVATEVDAGDRLKVYAADLTADAGWDEAMKGVDFVWHVASPLGGNSPKDPNALIVPAREGNIARLARRAKSKREAHDPDFVDRCIQRADRRSQQRQRRDDVDGPDVEKRQRLSPIESNS